MRVKVEVYGLLRDRVGGEAKMEMELPDGSTVADLVARLGVGESDPWIASLDGSLVNDATPLIDGCHLLVMPPMEGGQHEVAGTSQEASS